MRTVVPATAACLLAFAANSILCRIALAEPAIDATSFTTLRIASGAAALAPLLLRRRRARPELAASPAPTASGAGTPGPRWAPALALTAYAFGFSWAYRTLEAGTGALLLFGAVQVTMIGFGLRAGERPSARQVAGYVAAVAGLGWLVAPGVSAPDPFGALLMAGAGVAWGAYSLFGRVERTPLLATARNFARALAPAVAVAFAVVLAVALAPGTLASSAGLHATPKGVGCALLSGAVTSGLGYVLWYATLPQLSATTAAIVQLAVPAIAAIGGVLLLGEAPTPRLVGSGLLTLGGVALAVTNAPAARD